MVTAASCAGVQPCSKLDLLTTDNMHRVTFKIRTTLTNSVIYDSSTITIDVQCRTGSTSITSTITSADGDDNWWEQWNRVNNTWSWPKFTCQYMDCCRTLTYQVVKTNTNPVTAFPTSGVGPDQWWSAPAVNNVVGNANYGRVVSELYTGHLQSPTTYYIYCSNEWSDYTWSMALKFRVVYDCSMDVFKINPLPYNEKTEGELKLVNQTYTNWTYLNNLPVL